MSFFLMATEVINNKVADFYSLPMPTSLELAYALVEIKKVLGDMFMTPLPDSDLADTVGYLLKEEGYSEPVSPFEFVPQSKLTAGQEPADTENKKMALHIYIKHMNEL